MDKFKLDDFRFISSESYEPDEEIEETPEEESKNILSDFLKDNSPKGIFKKWIVLFLFFLYLLWVSAQYLIGIFNTDLKISVLPHRVIVNVVRGNLTLALLTGLVAAFLSAAIILAFRKKTSMTEEEFKLSQNITHGSAKFATDESMRGAIIFHELSNPRGIILGRKSGIEVSVRTDAVNILSDEAYQNLKDDLAVCVDRTLQRNMNVFVIGPPGSGKSYGYGRSNVLARIANKESFVITDPSGEIYRDTAALAKKAGFTVRILNLTKPNISDGWNPFDILRGCDPMEVQTLTATLVHTILSNTVDDNAKGDVFFDQSEENLLKALILYVAISPHFAGEEYERHMGTVYDLLAKLAAQEGVLEEFALLPDSDPAATPWKLFQGAGRLKANFITGLASRIEIFQVDMIKEMFSHSEIDISALGQKPCAYYIVSPVTNNKMRFLLSLFFSCAFEGLINDATVSGGQLKVPVYFILDEFKAIGRINGFADIMNNVRKYGISVSPILQDLGQIQTAYPKDWSSIMSACDTWVAIGVNEFETAKKLSERSGISTAQAESQAHSQLKRSPISPVDPMLKINVSDQKRNLMNPDEIMRYFDDEGTNDRKVLVFARNKNPYKLKAYGWPLHCLSKDVEQIEVTDHIPQWQKGEWTINKKRTFLSADTNDSSNLYGGKSKESDEYKEKARKKFSYDDLKKTEETNEEKAKKKSGGVVFNSDAKSTHLVELGLDLSGKKRV